MEYFLGVFLYLVFVLKLGPYLMKNREPFKLNKILVTYNVSQILINLYIFVTIITILPKINIICTTVEDEEMKIIPKFSYLIKLYVFLKLYDFLDTVFFVLRKKQQQVSFLHVYHHVTIYSMSWFGLKYLPPSKDVHMSLMLALGFMNTLVHTIMYCYYLLAVLKIESVKNAWWKKYITILQLVQHYTLLILGVIALINPKCPFPKNVLMIGIICLMLLIYLFTKFYQEAYTGKNKSKRQVH